ncbi:uncharacterized mitochondrial protein AtMg00810-like [Nicotiana sylvestris]|uniref:uncharacterized mitochondrial protein AtMg00810-like n=1 Tax=Nicotiana sylvestris TaxID=4096 RepID=UPI00388C4DEF
MVLVYVDDLLITGSSQHLLKQIRDKLQTKFKMKDLGELKLFLGIEFARSSKGIVMCQRKYAVELITEVHVLSQYMHSPKVSHMEAALRVVKYIKEATGLGLLMPAKSSNQLLTYCDSDWGACLQTRSSVTGYLVKFKDALFSWK